ncbi:hypothetical protein Tco_0073230 [Tanacetum coccineum]
MGRSSRKSLCDRRPASGTQAFRYAGVEDTVVVLRPFKDSVVYRFQFVNEPVVENSLAMSSKEEPKVVRKNDDALIIEEWVSDDEVEDVSQHKTEKKTVRLVLLKKEFVKIKQQDNILGKLLNMLSYIGKTTTISRGNQRN